MSAWSTALLGLVSIVIAVLYWVRRYYAYWWRRRIPYLRPQPLFGNLRTLFDSAAPFAEHLSRVYFEPAFAEAPVVGLYFFHKPCLLVRDLELAKTILVEDFCNFSDRHAACDAHGDKIGALNLFFVKHPEWREIRTKLGPVFASSKLQRMFPLMQEVGAALEAHLAALTLNGAASSEVDVKGVCALFAADMTASTAFGLRSDNLLRCPPGRHRGGCPKRRHMLENSLRQSFDYFLVFFLPRLAHLMRARLFADGHAEFLRHTVDAALEERERSGEVRNDLIDVLLTLQKEAALHPDETHFGRDRDYLVAQAAMFEVAGFGPCSATMTFALYELARHPEIQTRLRREICEAFVDSSTNGSTDGCIDFERLRRLPYLDMVLDETLRLYPPLPFLDRTCTPLNGRRMHSLRPFAEVNLPKGLPLFVPVLAIHRDPKFWPDPDRFDPERFSPENRCTQTPHAYMPFGAGPHNCIGWRTGLLQTKLGLVHCLRSHRVQICPRTPTTMRFNAHSVLLTSEAEVYLNVVRCEAVANNNSSNE